MQIARLTPGLVSFELRFPTQAGSGDFGQLLLVSKGLMERIGTI